MFGRAICQRCTGTPVQHLTGEQAFRGIILEVRPGVFVPRPETEVLVEHGLEILGKAEDPVVVDAGTGTGAIALAVKDERPDATVFATDLSPEAVELARENAVRLGLQVTILEGDLLEALPEDLRGWVDLVISNPPYVPAEELEDLPVEVRADPRLALVGGVELVARLASQALRWLRDGGALVIEIDARYGVEVSEMLGRDFTGVRVERDLAGRDRVVVASQAVTNEAPQSPIEDAARAALGGGLIVFPTETVYGIGTRPDDPAATARLFEAKGRPRDLELPVLVGSTEAARAIAVFDERAEVLALRFWAGPLTIVLPRSASSRAWELGGDPGTIGVRMPHHPLALAILAKTGPLAVTSANRSGEPPGSTCEELAVTFGGAVQAYLCAREPLDGRPSTVVDLSTTAWRLLRMGAVTERDVAAALLPTPSSPA